MDDMMEVTSWEPPNAVERRIAELPVVRRPRFRGDRGRVALERHLSYRQAIMAFIRGYIPNRACAHCRNGHGAMMNCVRLKADAEHFFSSHCSFYLPPTRPRSRAWSRNFEETRRSPGNC